MIPLRDNVRADRTPVVNYTIIGVTALVFLAQLGNSMLVYEYGMIPRWILEPALQIPAQIRTERGIEIVVLQSTISPVLTMLTCVFLHGGWMHFLGNMWFLVIFGDNVEDRLGHVGYAIFYLASGVIASLTHFATNSESTVPTIGASGAVAGVMGAYFLLYPKARVLTLVPLGFILTTIVIPAPVFLGIWFVIQFFQGLASIGAVQTGGVAWWAHIGGFAIGAIVVIAMRKLRLLPSREVEWLTHQTGAWNGRRRHR